MIPAAISALLLQLLHVALALAAAPLLVGSTRFAKSRLQGRRGPSPIQPYRDLLRLLRKETVLAHDASWIFRVTPYLVFSIMTVAAAMVPMFVLDLPLARAGDLIAIVALIATARFFQSLAGLDIGTAFGGIGASREALIGSLAEPAVLMVAFALALVAGTTALPAIARFVLSGGVGVEVSLALALIAFLIVAIAENGRVPVDNPATHLELTMVHEAMVLEYSGRNLALIEAAQMLKLLVFISLISALFAPWGMASAEDGLDFLEVLAGIAVFGLHLLVAAILIAAVELAIAKMRVFRVVEFLGGAFILAVLAVVFRFVTEAS
ncbi:MAG: NADH-quinone oxidoreductase subunit H [Rhodospirillaceae bacterium]|nr:NADH-quinone oxidoreductase subunit H [Rhodospirillaceae bacterium]